MKHDYQLNSTVADYMALTRNIAQFLKQTAPSVYGLWPQVCMFYHQ